MKKVISLLFAICLAVTLVGKAQAAWEANHLYQVWYDETANVECAKDLGSIGDLIGSPIIIDPIDPMPGYQVGFYGYDAVNKDYYFATTKDTKPAATGNKQSGYVSAVSATYNYYKTLDTDLDGDAEGQTSNPSSYWVKMNSSTPGSAGQYAGLNAGYTGLGKLGEDDLSDGFQDMYLYKFHSTGTFSVSFVPGNGTDYQNIITANAVPLPGAMILLASGLLGLVGIKRS